MAQKITKSNIAFSALDSIISHDIANGFTSAQMVVMQDGEIIFENAWGNINSYDDAGNRIIDGVPVDMNTLYDLASNTKMYSIVYAIQHLVSNNELDIDTRIVDVIGQDFADEVIDISYENGANPAIEVQKEWKRSVTVRDVLSHRAGFPPFVSYFNNSFNLSTLKIEKDAENLLYQGENSSRENTLKLICKTPLMQAPKGKPVYSDIDYMLLAFVLEKVVGMPLEEYLSKTFFEPMGLKNITYKPLENGFDKNKIAATELHGNTRDFAVDFPNIRKYLLQGEVHDECAYYSMHGVSGHAGLFSNARDLAKLCSLMIDGTYNGVKYFSKEVIEEFTSPISKEYSDWGIGWWRKSGELRNNYFSALSPDGTVGHQGWTGTLSMIDRENKLVMVLLTNKINTPVTDAKKDTNMFDGKWFTSAYLFFAAPIIYSHLLYNDEKTRKSHILLALDDMIKLRKNALDILENPKENHPAKRAYDAILLAKDDINKFSNKS